MASGLSMPVGFKNGTDGQIQVALDAMKSSLMPHHFLGINQDGKISKFSTRGNPYGHIVLRGGGGRGNYDATSIATCEQALEKASLRKKIVIDCSHANSDKDHNKQPAVLTEVSRQLIAGNRSLCGVMIESNLFAGNQPIPKDLSKLQYGVSVTDQCVDWPTTEVMIRQAFAALP
jgi:3-deoxy-7-phosphoheptulonate synthase